MSENLEYSRIVPREIGDNFMQTWGINKVHNGLGENGESSTVAILLKRNTSNFLSFNLC